MFVSRVSVTSKLVNAKVVEANGHINPSPPHRSKPDRFMDTQTSRAKAQDAERQLLEQQAAEVSRLLSLLGNAKRAADPVLPDDAQGDECRRIWSRRSISASRRCRSI